MMFSTSLELLNLRANNMGYVGAAVIGEALKVNTSH